MAVNKLTIPTGYETAQLAAERKRKIAQALLEKGLQSNNNMTSWAQVGAQLADAFAGSRLDKKADNMDAATRAQMMQDYAKASSDFHAATADPNSSPDSITNRFDTNPWLQDDLKPYQDAIAERLKQREQFSTFGGQFRKKGDIPLGSIDPNSAVIPGPNNSIQVNPVKVTASQLSQAMGPWTPPYTPSMQMPGVGGGAPAPSPTPINPTAPVPSAGGGDFLTPDQKKFLSPEEQQIFATEMARRAGQGGSGGGGYALQNDMHTPMGNPLTAIKPPAGVANGKPYWLINGVPYDNPEGK